MPAEGSTPGRSRCWISRSAGHFSAGSWPWSWRACPTTAQPQHQRPRRRHWCSLGPAVNKVRKTNKTAPAESNTEIESTLSLHPAGVSLTVRWHKPSTREIVLVSLDSLVPQRAQKLGWLAGWPYGRGRAAYPISCVSLPNQPTNQSGRASRTRALSLRPVCSWWSRQSWLSPLLLPSTARPAGAAPCVCPWLRLPCGSFPTMRGCASLRATAVHPRLETWTWHHMDKMSYYGSEMGRWDGRRI